MLSKENTATREIIKDFLSKSDFLPSLSPASRYPSFPFMRIPSFVAETPPYAIKGGLALMWLFFMVFVSQIMVGFGPGAGLEEMIEKRVKMKLGKVVTLGITHWKFWHSFALVLYFSLYFLRQDVYSKQGIILFDTQVLKI